jgi:hypothetical protein
MPLNLLFLLQRTRVHRPYIFFLFLAVIGVVFGLNWISGGRILKYLTNPKDKTTAVTMSGIHIFLSLFVALFIPNNVLTEIDFFNKLFQSNKDWVPATMLIILMFNVVILGFIFSRFNSNQKD